MKRNKTIGIIVLVFTLLLFTSSRCCNNDYCKAIKAAVADDRITNEEAMVLKDAYANHFDLELDSISDWTELIEDVFSQSENINYSELVKIFYPKQTKVIVYLDNTYSMKGYARASNPLAFTSLFEAIKVNYSADSSAKIEARYVSKNDVAKKVDFDVMRGALTKRTWAKGDKDEKDPYTDSYQMNELFDAIKDMVLESKNKDEEVICFFVSDMIPSTDGKEIKNDPQTMLQISEKIVTDIGNSIRPLASGDNLYAASLYQFFAPFGSDKKDKDGKYIDEGIYYKYTNAHLKLHGEKRPVYVMAIGNKNAVSEWNDKVLVGLRNFSYENYAFINGNIVDIVPQGYAKIDGDKMSFTIDKDEKTVYLDINPNTLPSYLTTKDSALIVSLNGRPCNMDENGRVNLGKPDNIDGGTLRIQVKDAVPEWIRNSSSEDDSKLSAKDTIGMTQTFFLERVFRSIAQGLSNADGRMVLYDKSYTIEINNNK